MQGQPRFSQYAIVPTKFSTSLWFENTGNTRPYSSPKAHWNILSVYKNTQSYVSDEIDEKVSFSILLCVFYTLRYSVEATRTIDEYR